MYSKIKKDKKDWPHFFIYFISNTQDPYFEGGKIYGISLGDPFNKGKFVIKGDKREIEAWIEEGNASENHIVDLTSEGFVSDYYTQFYVDNNLWQDRFAETDNIIINALFERFLDIESPAKKEALPKKIKDSDVIEFFTLYFKLILKYNEIDSSFSSMDARMKKTVFGDKSLRLWGLFRDSYMNYGDKGMEKVFYDYIESQKDSINKAYYQHLLKMLSKAPIEKSKIFSRIGLSPKGLDLRSNLLRMYPYLFFMRNIIHSLRMKFPNIKTSTSIVRSVGHPYIDFSFWLNDQKDLPSKIIQNDPMYHRFTFKDKPFSNDDYGDYTNFFQKINNQILDDKNTKGDKIYSESMTRRNLLLKDRTNVAPKFRKKTGNFDQTTKHFEKYFKELKKKYEENKSNIISYSK